jgi:methyltransferase
VDSRVVFTCIVGLVAVARLGELAVSRRNQRRLEARGAVEAGGDHYPWMVAMHTAFLFSAPAEVWLLDRPLIPWLAAAAAVVFAAATGLRVWTLAALGDRWTTRVLVVPGDPLVTRGPYRWLRHPNYAAVALEIASIPLLHTAWWTAAAFSLANAALLRVRIRTEEQALEDGSARAPRTTEAG